MSYEVSKADQQSRAMAQLADLQDYDRVKFLRWLADAQSEATVKPTQWESNFLATFFADVQATPGVRVITFSLKQREVIDGMKQKYGGSR